MVGIPGSGKSTYIKNCQAEHGGVIISRDEIRFSMIDTRDDYFSKEKQVFKTFVQKIQEALKDNEIVYADATHISEQSREKLLKALNLTDVSVRAIVLQTPLQDCIYFNSLRTGLQQVPKGVIRRMYYQLTDPADDKRKYDEIIYHIGGRIPV
jgi:predicted kinase